jgi:hypothetical protein
MRGVERWEWRVVRRLDRDVTQQTSLGDEHRDVQDEERDDEHPERKRGRSERQRDECRDERAD